MKNEIKYISVDTGKSHTKYAWFEGSVLDVKNIKADSFKSVISEIAPDELTRRETLITYDNKTYDVGGNDGRALESSNSKLSNHHKLCTYVAIAKALLRISENNRSTHIIDLSINIPLAEFKIKKEEYIQGYKGKVVSIMINNKKIDFMIGNVRASYEAAGAAVRNIKDGINNAHIIDIGGKNDTHISFENVDDQVKPVKDKNGMFNNGVLTLLQTIASDLSTDFDVTIEDVEKIIAGNLSKPENYDRVFDQRTTSHVAMIKNQVQKYKLNPMFTKLILSGGGSLLLRNQLEIAFSEYKPIFSSDAQFDNVKGALERVIR